MFMLLYMMTHVYVIIHDDFLLFSDRPMTYLFNTLHYYEKKLKDKPQMKKKLVNAIIGQHVTACVVPALHFLGTSFH